MSEEMAVTVESGKVRRGAPPVESAETQQLRAEVALLRARLEGEIERQKLMEEDKKKYAEFLAWIGKSTEEKTQMVADRMFQRMPGDKVWQVELPEQPKIRVPAHSDFEAIGRYAQVCGITSTAHKYTAVEVG